MKANIQEIWKPIPEFKAYQASNLGRIKCRNGKIMKASVKGRARVYLGVVLFESGKQYCRYVHRLVATAHCPNPNNLPEVNHINCIRIDNASDNLEWVTHKQNMAHAVLNRLVPHGINQISAKLTEDQVREMRRLKKDNPKITYQQLGDMFGIDNSNAYRTCIRVNYKYVV